MLSAPRPTAYCSSRSTPCSLSSRVAGATHPRTLASVSRRRMRQLTVATAVAACTVALAGCNNANLTRREAVVHFDPSATTADHTRVREACATAAPHASPEPAPSASTRGVSPPYDVRFRVDHASDRDLNQLYQCLMHQPGVLGVDVPDAGG